MSQTLTSPVADSADLLTAGPWRHRFVAANGARFHVAEAGSGPLVLLLHGFPQFWWTWRHQLTALADAGYRTVAMDLRGYGCSDKPPRGYDPFTMAHDVAGVVRALGESEAIIVGHDWGGWLGWAMPSLAPGITRGVAVVSMPHPLQLRAGLHSPHAWTGTSRLLRAQVPMAPERWLRAGGARTHLQRFSQVTLAEADLQVYQHAMRVPFVAHTSQEYLRWAIRSLIRKDGRNFAAAVRHPISVPVLQVHGRQDRLVPPALACATHGLFDARGAAAHTQVTLEGAGHFVPDEAPQELNQALITWLRQIA